MRENEGEMTGNGGRRWETTGRDPEKPRGAAFGGERRSVAV
jgi:hypothetical protein